MKDFYIEHYKTLFKETFKDLKKKKVRQSEFMDLPLFMKVNSKSFIGLNVKMQNYNTSKDITGENLDNLSFL